MKDTEKNIILKLSRQKEKKDKYFTGVKVIFQ
jgi:hypothetical protein